jgi:hypothetical protein
MFLGQQVRLRSPDERNIVGCVVCVYDCQEAALSSLYIQPCRATHFNPLCALTDYSFSSSSNSALCNPFTIGPGRCT